MKGTENTGILGGTVLALQSVVLMKTPMDTYWENLHAPATSFEDQMTQSIAFSELVLLLKRIDLVPL